eukprot:gene12401-14651_t
MSDLDETVPEPFDHCSSNSACYRLAEYRIPETPRYLSTPIYFGTTTGIHEAVGVTLDGIPIWAPLDELDEDRPFKEWSTTGECNGVPSSLGEYHYNGVPKCLFERTVVSSLEHSPLLGYMFDGFGIYGQLDVYGQFPDDLDACNGHVSSLPD